MKTLKTISVVRGYHGLIVGLLIPIFVTGSYSRASGVQHNQEPEYFHPFKNEEVLPLWHSKRPLEVEWKADVGPTLQIAPLIWGACVLGSVVAGAIGRFIINFDTACMKVDSKPLPIPGKEGEDDGTGISAASGPLYYGTCSCRTNVALASFDEVVEEQREPVVSHTVTLRVWTSLDDTGTLSSSYQVEPGQPPVPIAEANAAMASWGLPPLVVNRNPIHTIDGVEVPASESPIFIGNGKIVLHGPDYDGLQMVNVEIRMTNVLDGNMQPFVNVIAPVGRELEMHFVREDAGFFQVASELVW